MARLVFDSSYLVAWLDTAPADLVRTRPEILDRVTAALGAPAGSRSSLLGIIARRRDQRRRAAASAVPADAALQPA